MELYFKELISADASLEKLVDNLSLVVQGVDDLAKSVGEGISDESRREVVGRLTQLKDKCRELKERTVEGARQTDLFLRRNPYAVIGVAFGLGLMAGVRLRAARDAKNS